MPFKSLEFPRSGIQIRLTPSFLETLLNIIKIIGLGEVLGDIPTFASNTQSQVADMSIF